MREDTRAALQANFSGIDVGDVEIVPNKDLKARDRPYVPPADSVPELHELWVTMVAAIDRDRSSVERERRCEACGRIRWLVYGVDRWDADVDPETKEVSYQLVPRQPGSGLFVPRREFGNVEMFQIKEFAGGGWIFCTDPVRDFILERELTNISFLEVGTVID